ncbi:MAG: LPXTG cell wall anchor domain-containing protein [Planctomycetota bacterium]
MELAFLGFQTWQILLIVGLAILVIVLLIIKKRQEQ